MILNKQQIPDNSIIYIENVRHQIEKGQINILHLWSPSIKINYGGDLIPLNIYINNNAYTNENGYVPNYYYPLVKGGRFVDESLDN